VIEIFDARVNTTYDTKTGLYTTQAVIADVIIQATITTTLPTWRERGSASQAEQAKWDGYLEQLKGFQAEHAKDTFVRLDQYRSSLLGLRGTGSGNTRESAMQMAANQINAKYSEAKNTLFQNYNADGKRRDANGGHTIRPY